MYSFYSVYSFCCVVGFVHCLSLRIRKITSTDRCFFTSRSAFCIIAGPREARKPNLNIDQRNCVLSVRARFITGTLKPEVEIFLYH